MFFESYILASYNHNVGIMADTKCSCYDCYSNEAVFIKTIIEERGSYMTCICYEAMIRTRTGHRSVPIMLGSYIDYIIRGRDAVLASRGQWGLVILRGILKIYDNFSTFDALSMHVRQTKH